MRKVSKNSYKVAIALLVFVTLMLSGCRDPNLTQAQSSYRLLGLGKSDLTLLSDIKVGDLRIRYLRITDERCRSGYRKNLLIEGVIGPDSTAVLAKMLPGIDVECDTGSRLKKSSRVVYLNSEGGVLEDGVAMGRLFSRYDVEARVVNRCASACAVAFVGASARSLSENSELVFHAPYIKSPFGFKCSGREEASGLRSFYTAQLGEANGNYLFRRTMEHCSVSDGWSVNRDAAKLFGLLLN